MKSKKKTLSATMAISLLALTGCATLPSGMNVNRAFSPRVLAPQNAQRIQQVRIGKIVGLVPVMIRSDNREKRTGSGIGAALGGLLGHSLGGGRGKTIAAIAGAIAGGVGGNVAAQHLYKVPGEQVSVQLASGRIVAVTQAIPRIPLYVHESVEIVGSGWSGSAARVLPLPRSQSKTTGAKK